MKTKSFYISFVVGEANAVPAGLRIKTLSNYIGLLVKGVSMSVGIAQLSL